MQGPMPMEQVYKMWFSQMGLEFQLQKLHRNDQVS